MKKLLLIIIVFVTSLSYCQTAEEYFNSGYSKRNLYDYKGSIADYSKAIQLNPSYSEAYYNRGSSKHYLKDYKGSIPDYSKAIQLNPSYGDAYLHRGLCKLELNQKNSACLDWSKAGEEGVWAYHLIEKYCD